MTFEHVLAARDPSKGFASSVKLRIAFIIENMADTRKQLAWHEAQGDADMVAFMQKSLEEQVELLREARRGMLG